MKKNASAVVVVALTVVWVGACYRQPQSKGVAEVKPAAEENQQELKTLEDRYSYAYGADLAKSFKAEGVKLNVALMAAAMQAEFDGQPMKMSAGEVAATFEVFQEVHRKEKEAARVVAAEKNKKEGAVFLTENAKKEGVVVTKSGLQYKVIAKGNGSYKPTVEDEVTVNYRGRLLDGTEFDSTYARNEPFSSVVQALMQGWIEALQLMSKGSKWELYIPANLAYGEEGSPPYVGPSAVLIFEVELLGVKENK